MKIIFTLALLSSFFLSNAQHKGYGQFGPSVFTNGDFGTVGGINASGGAIVGNVGSIGAGVDYFLINKSESKQFAQLYADFRFYILGTKKANTPYVAFQPGAVLYNKTIGNLTTKGGFAVNGLAGFLSRSAKGPGITAAAGVSVITFSNKDIRKDYVGFKAVIGFIF